MLVLVSHVYSRILFFILCIEKKIACVNLRLKNVSDYIVASYLLLKKKLA